MDTLKMCNFVLISVKFTDHTINRNNFGLINFSKDFLRIQYVSDARKVLKTIKGENLT